MDEVPWKAIWIVGGVLAGLAIIGLLSPWAMEYIGGVLPG